MASTPPHSHEEAQREFALTLSGFSATDKPEYEDYSRCVHCGLCSNQCPTYRLWGREADSPRGRIRQMVLVDQGTARAGRRVRQAHRSMPELPRCEIGVSFGRGVRTSCSNARGRRSSKNTSARYFRGVARDFVYRRLLPYPGRIAAAARLLKFYQRSGLAALARGTGILRLLGLQDRERLLPKIDSDFFFSELGKTYPAKGTRRARVALFAGCVAQVTFSELNRATIRVLQANGCEVVVPDGPNLLRCAGGACRRSRRGSRPGAHESGRVPPDEFDAIITNAAGCGSTLKEYPKFFSKRRLERTARRRSFQPRSSDVTEFLAELGLVAPLRSVAASRYLSGFLPSLPRSASARSPAQIDTRHSRA